MNKTNKIPSILIKIIALIIFITAIIFAVKEYKHDTDLDTTTQNAESAQGVATSSADEVNGSNNNEAGKTKNFKFLGYDYSIGYTFPQSKAQDFNSEGYEWVKGGETVENWKTLVTTYKLSPIDSSTPLKPEIYAENVSADLKTKGATLIETSVISNDDAKASGVDTSNPPYLLVYMFPADEQGLTEFDVQKIQGTADGKVLITIYAEEKAFDNKFKDTRHAQISGFIGSDEYNKIRETVILSTFPY